MKIGLYFGSFNPIHIGHLLVATYIKEIAGLDEIWFIVSPQNPFKQNSDLADENHRLEMVKLAIQKIKYFKISTIEFHLPKPSYTHLTIKEFKKKYPNNIFKLIIGQDNLEKFHLWKEKEWIINNIELLVYNRNTENKIINNTYSNFKILKLPMFDISSTTIRNRIKEQKNIDFFTNDIVKQYIIKHNLYKI